MADRLTMMVLSLSDSFAGLWPDLAHDVQATLSESDATAVAGPDVAVVVLAAGGTDQAALRWLESAPGSGVPRFVVGSDTGRRIAAQVVAAGAADYFALPEDLELLRNAVAAAVERRRAALARLAGETPVKADAFNQLVGESAALRAALGRAARVLPHGDATVLITGETGTGKELLARALHHGGPRRTGPFVEGNCTALPANLLESELFGHERGAFTDAHATKPGLFEVADGGTLFLDEMGHLALELQAKLLRAIEDKQVRRVGGMASRKVDVRIVAATNEDLEQAVRAGTFRADLFFRLSVIALSLPPLRERGEDVVRIGETLLARLAAQYQLPAPRLDHGVRRALLGYHWPGNVRELKNAVERALLLSPPGELRLDELRLEGAGGVRAGTGAIPFPAPLDDITSAATRATLDLCNGNRSEAARRLGISRARLARLLND